MATSNLNEAHQASERIEGHTPPGSERQRIVIHYEPEEKVHLRYAVPLQDREGLVGDHPGEAPSFAIFDVDVRTDRVERQDIVAPSQALKSGRACR